MASEYRVRLIAQTKEAEDKLNAVESTLTGLTKKQHTVNVGVDAKALVQGAKKAEEVASNTKAAVNNIREAGGLSIVSQSSLAGAATLATTFYGLRKDVKGLMGDLGKSVSKTNVSEFMRTEKFLDRVLDNSRTRSKEIVETYQNLREIPGAAEILSPVENYARAEAWKRFGGDIAQQTLQGLRDGFQANVKATQDFFYGELFNDIAAGTSRTIDTLARLGLAIQGLQLLVGPLASAWSAAFDTIIGQNVRLEQTILSTQTTLASTGRILDRSTGQIVEDPLLRINALGDDVRKSIDNIRTRSLDLAGVTSSQIIDIFGVVATSISQVNGDIKDAEDLAISFTAALGTLGIPFYQARQEIGSILGGYITEDSLLAKRLQISNQDIAKAKQSIDGVTGYLKKKLEVAVAGQAISAKSFAGVTSNIQEVFEVIGQRIGAPLLQPLVAGLTVVYNILKKIQDVVSAVGSYLASTLVDTIRTIVSAVSSSNLARSIRSSLDSISQPFQDLAKSIERGFTDSGSAITLLKDWVSGVREVPAAYRNLVNALVSIGNFLKQQVALIVEPIVQLLDQTRKRLNPSGWQGVVQSISRGPQFLLGEGTDSFSKGWDTITSTIQYAAQAVIKFGTAIARLKIVEFTATIRAAAKVFEIFGSMFLGKINLALSFFDSIANVINDWEIFGANVAEVVVSLVAINRLLNATETFGLRGLVVWAAQTSTIFKQLRTDVALFIKGFRDAGNIENLIKNAQTATQKVLGIEATSKNPALANLASIQRLKAELETLQKSKAALGGLGTVENAAELANYTKKIEQTTDALRKAEAAQQRFSKVQQASAMAQRFFGGGADVAQAREAARQAGVLASGASAAQALRGIMDGLAQKLGLTTEQMKGLGGAFRVATRSAQTFLTTTLLINLAFTALTIAIAGGIALWQQYEERVKRTNEKLFNTARIQQILASGWTSIIKAAEGGDVAAQNRLDAYREAAQTEFNIESQNLNKLQKEYSKINDKLFARKKLAESLAKISGARKVLIDQGVGNIDEAKLARDILDLEKQQTANKQKQADIEAAIFKARQALNKLQQEEQLNRTFEVLGQRRTDLEQRIKTAREDFEKEIADKAFQARMEGLNLEQQRRREIQSQELDALRNRFALIKGNSVQEDQKILDLAEQYATVRKQATDNELNRRAEYTQRELQVKKSIEDYAFKIAREKAALEKQVGAYRKEVADYELKMSQKKSREELVRAQQKEIIGFSTWQPYNLEQQQQFQNNAQKVTGLSVPDAYAILQLIDKQQLQVTSGSTALDVLKRLQVILEANAKAGVPTTPEGILMRTTAIKDPEIARKYADSLRDEAKTVFNLGRFMSKQDQSNIKAPNLNIDYTGMEKRVGQFETSVLQSLEDLNTAVRNGDRARIEQILRQARDPSTLTDVKSDYYLPKAQAEAAARSALDAVKTLGKGSDALKQELEVVENSYLGALRAFIKTFYHTPEKVAAQMKFVLDGGLQKIKQNLNPQGQFMLAISDAYETAKERVKTTSADRAAIEFSNKFKGLAETVQGEILSFRNNGIQQALSDFTAAVGQATNQTYSLAKAQADVNQKTFAFFLGKLSEFNGPLTSENVDMIRQLASQYRDSLMQTVKILDPFNKAFEVYKQRVEQANQATQAYMGAYKTFLTDILRGNKNFADATASFTESIANEATNMFVDYITKSMQENMKRLFDQIFGVDKAKQNAEQALTSALGSVTSSTQELTQVLRELTTTIKNPAPVPTTATPPASAPATPDTPTAPAPAPATPGPAGTTPQGVQDLNKSASKLSKTLDKAQAPASELPNQLTGFQKTMGNVATGLGSIAMAIGGVQQMKKGGTYNVLMGLAGIFGGISNFTGMFSPKIKLFAEGGTLPAGRFGIAGERGPELLYSGQPTTVIPAGKTRDLFAATRASLSNQAAGADRSTRNLSSESSRSRTINVRYESQVINNVEYVTVEQHRKGMQEAAQLGQSLAYQGIRSSAPTRKRLGI